MRWLNTIRELLFKDRRPDLEIRRERIHPDRQPAKDAPGTSPGGMSIEEIRDQIIAAR